ncbi:hypothetical protein [Ornithinimicrobium sufpigmenti]|uniref:hypothetical protein n=1 Tax=Ornithinimicrobium sufpigmenti TaxID=2508882 RepID=UPI00192DB7D1|nr:MULTISPECIES: hypothetical protein [unclassified Ornithinimicrobium]
MLAEVPHFARMSNDDQLALYRQLVNARAFELARPETSRAMADARRAGDLIDDSRHRNDRIDQAGDLAGDFIDAVDFPQFVRDLLKAVFDANLQVTLQQMEAYGALLKTATQSLARFAQAIPPADAFAYLAENNSDEFSVNWPPEGGEAELTDKEGNTVDTEDSAVKAKIMDATLAMAKEQRALLRETILMGITRLVVEKGVVKAAVVFDIKAGEKITKSDRGMVQDARSDSSSFGASGGLIGSIIGGPRGGHTRSNRHTQISVSSAKSDASTDLTAKVTGSVEINFKSDYFKLDNFATMYGPIDQSGGPAAPGASAALPPATVR